MDSTVLIAEPHDARAAQYEHLVRSQGFTPLRVTNGEAALTQLRKMKPGLIITELQLPGIDGFELLRQARKLEPRPKTLVISAVREMRDVAAQQRLELGIDGLLATSSPMSSIERALRRLLSPTSAAESAGPIVAPTDTVSPAVRFPEGSAEPAVVESNPPSSPPAGPKTQGPSAALTPLDQLRGPSAAAPSPRAGFLAPGVPTEEHLDALVRDIGRPFGVVGAVIAFTLAGQQWIRAHVRLGGRWADEVGGARAVSLVAPIVSAGVPIVVSEASEHPELATHPLVREGLLRGYAGIPLQVGGHTFGAVCLLDQRPLPLGPPAIEHLKMLASWLGTEVSLREEVSRRASEADSLRAGGSELQRAAADARAFLGAVVVASTEGVALFDAGRRLIAINEPLTQITGIDRARAMTMDMNGWTRAFGSLVRDPQRFGWIANGLPAGPFSLREEIEIVNPKSRTLRWTARPVRLTGGAIGFVFAYAEVITVPDVTEDALEISALE